MTLLPQIKMTLNPFEKLDKKNGLNRNEKSPFYGRYRLRFNQVLPFREPLYDRLVLKIKEKENAKIIFNYLPEHINFIHYLKQIDIRGNKYWGIDFFKDKEEFLVFEMLSDVKYIAVENIYFSFLELAPYIEDCHFFIFSSGDGDERWIDEYIIKNNKFKFKRNTTDKEIYWGRLDFYIDWLNENDENKNFMRFVLFQIYDHLYYSVKELNNYQTIDSLKNSRLHKNFQYYIKKLYSIDKECSDLKKLIKKYEFKIE